MIKEMNSNIDTDYESESIWIPSQQVGKVHIATFSGIEEPVKTKLGISICPILENLWCLNEKGSITLYATKAVVFQQVLQQSFEPTGEHTKEATRPPTIYIARLIQPGKSFLWEPVPEDHPAWKLAMQLTALPNFDELPPELTEAEPF